MIKLNGVSYLTVGFEVELDMTEEEFHALSSREQNEKIENAVDWQSACRNAEIEGIDVWDVEEAPTHD